MIRVEVEDLLSRMGSGRYRMTGEWLMGRCPMARWNHESGKDENPSFGVNLDTGFTHCFACLWRGSLYKLVREWGRRAHQDQEENDEWAARVLLMGDLPKTRRPEQEAPPVPEEVLAGLGQYHPYMQVRGIDERTASAWNLGYIKDEGGRVLFPVYDVYGDLVGVTGRAIVDGVKPKYRTYPPKFPKSHHLFGSDQVGEKTVGLVVEGPLDAVTAGQYLPVEYAVAALLGAEMSKEQANLVLQLFDRVILCLDNDSSGVLGTQKAINLLAPKIPVYLAQYPPGVKDPGEAGDRIREMVRGRKSHLTYRLESIFDKYQIG